MTRLYVLCHAKTSRTKIEITGNFVRLLREINENIKAQTCCYDVIALPVLPMPFAESKERLLHKCYAARRKSFDKGSGKSEWFELGFFARMFLIAELYFKFALYVVFFCFVGGFFTLFF